MFNYTITKLIPSNHTRKIQYFSCREPQRNMKLINHRQPIRPIILENSEKIPIHPNKFVRKFPQVNSKDVSRESECLLI